MNKLTYMAGVAIAAMAISSCDEDTQSIGNSLTNENDKLDVTDGVFYATTRTIVADSVLALSDNCYLGRIIDPETRSKAEVKSEFTSQFHLLETLLISPEEKIVGRTNDGRAKADSCDVILYLSSPFRSTDSLIAMKMQLLEMDAPIESGKTYYSNYDPFAKGLIRTDGIKKNKMFTYRNLTDSDTLREKSTYLNNIRITLNEPYTDKQGKTYASYGTYIMHQYYDHPEYYRNSYMFAHNVCPGFFFGITDGFGFYSKVSHVGLRVFYRVQVNNDSISSKSLVLAGTNEVKKTNKITNDQTAINELASETGCTYLKTPAGLFTEVTLPVTDIKSNHDKDSLLAARITFQRLNNNSDNLRKFNIPQSILMIQKDSLISYFEKLRVPDSKMSYLTTFNSSLNTYTFSNISNLVTELWNVKVKGEKTNSNWVAEHPNWNKVILIPVTYTTSSSSSTPTRVEHDMSLSSTRLVGGPNNSVELSVVYAKFH